MPIAIKTVFRGMQARPEVERRIEEWAAKLDTAFADIKKCDVVVEVPHRHHRQGRAFHVRITLTVPGDTIAISHDPGDGDSHDDVLVAVHDAFHAARRRLEDYVRRDLRREAPAL
jgi:ribosome-associated translation inhibitor RaiA